MKKLALVLGVLGLAACDQMGLGQGPATSAPQVSAERVDAFVVLVEQLNCQVSPDEAQHVQVHTAGFSDAEIVDIGDVLVGQNRAQLTDTGTLVLLTENCL
jgi:hypothetical protein